MYSLDSVQDYLTQHKIIWHFIPARSPHMGGVYERLIKEVKQCLKKSIGNSILYTRELDTVVNEIECCLNSRPLTQIAEGLSENDVLTPSKLIYGYDIHSLPIPLEHIDQDDDYVSSVAVSRRYKHLLKILDSFWKSWSLNYLPNIKQHRQNYGKSNIQVGEIVLIFENASRFRWKLGRITKLHHGKDGIVRSVNLDTAYGPTSRAITKLYPLELQEESRIHPAPVVPVVDPTPQSRVQRASAQAAKVKINSWIS
jgi:hypothetical protein